MSFETVSYVNRKYSGTPIASTNLSTYNCISVY
ncbi:hypothetical protein AAM22_gp96 [Pantoea phage vB_PagM_AAM22]|nr:hypothetical protein AAM22_gp96 [Pantoea phage vB_PagM_AAM22]